MKFFFCTLLLLAAGVNAFGTKGGQISQRYEEQSSAVASATAGEANPEPYSFSYSTGSGDASDTQTARHFREETKDVHGVVVGKYGYVDPYGKLRVVNYRAGPEGYTVTGDTGPDQEVQRQQRELYAADQSYQQQQAAWNSVRNSDSSSAAAAAAAVASAVHSSNNVASNTASNSEWTSVTSNSEARESTLSDKYRAEAIKSPASQIRESSRYTSQTAAYTAPVVEHERVNTYSAKTAAFTAPAVHHSTVHHTTSAIKSPSAQLRQYSYSYTAPQPAVVKKVITTTTNYHHSPAARLVQQWNSRSFGNSGAYTSGVKGYSGAFKAAPVAARLVAPSSSRGHTVVNFSQGGPVPYKYSYSF